ncbi:MAG: hypothetical protein JO332_10325, partial [Planctomycetaceae bacterium]|nr:hypothetical protein [Planctomycetaceae bacterium]
LGALSALCFLGAAVAGVVLFLRRRWLRVEADGFAVDGPGVKEAWRDVQVQRLSWVVTKNYTNGIAKTETCRLEVWNHQSRRLLLTHTKPLEAVTPFTEFAQRVFQNLRERTQAALAGGGRLEGEGWTLVRDKLTSKAGDLPIAEISGVGEFDGQVRVWKKGSNDAVFGVPIRTPNAVLLKVLVEELRPKEEGTARIESGDDLGKVLFERPGGQGRWMLYLLGVFLVLVGVLTFVASAGWGLAVLAAAVGILFRGWWVGGLMFRCHDWGVSRRTRRGTTTIRYRDIAEFTSRATRHFVNGAYTGTTLAMEFRSRPELGGEKISWSASLRGMDDEMDNLRNHISKVIAARWLELLKHGETLPWTENLRLTPSGVEFRPAGLFGRKDWAQATYEQIAGQKMEQGVFYLFLKGDKSACTQETVAATNFFPGFYVLMLVLQSSGAQP